MSLNLSRSNIESRMPSMDHDGQLKNSFNTYRFTEAEPHVSPEAFANSPPRISWTVCSESKHRISRILTCSELPETSSLDHVPQKRKPEDWYQIQLSGFQSIADLLVLLRGLVPCRVRPSGRIDEGQTNLLVGGLRATVVSLQFGTPLSHQCLKRKWVQRTVHPKVTEYQHSMEARGALQPSLDPCGLPLLHRGLGQRTNGQPRRGCGHGRGWVGSREFVSPEPGEREQVDLCQR
mmetsp:Transcript_29672/g.98296  ORF Transcript_29672/g.98296 Transcript_29672/m.98296 type:complete len:235 (+) Transcript_29672:122-826(+)